MIGLRKLSLLSLGCVSRALCVVHWFFQGRFGFFTQGLHLGLKAIHIQACLFSLVPSSLEQLLGHWRQARQLRINLCQGLLQPFVQPRVLGFYGCQSLIDHVLSAFQSNVDFALRLINDFVKRSASLIQRRIDLNKRLIQQFTKALPRNFNLRAQGGQMCIQLVELGLHGIRGGCQLSLGFVDDAMCLAAHFFNFGFDRR